MQTLKYLFSKLYSGQVADGFGCIILKKIHHNKDNHEVCKVAKVNKLVQPYYCLSSTPVLSLYTCSPSKLSALRPYF